MTKRYEISIRFRSGATKRLNMARPLKSQEVGSTNYRLPRAARRARVLQKGAGVHDGPLGEGEGSLGEGLCPTGAGGQGGLA